ncbi:tyrosine-type recombinase/integrase [Daeguia caeni]|uniref:Tyrosine-type recombinase/integrase n=1 Tax=Daeguia caeni TaxID=439612 RepID=A0ABV9H2E8_9HYPH
MRVLLKGVHRVRKRLADGSVRYYYYAWRGGPLLRGADGKILAPSDPEFHAAYSDAVKALTGGKKHTLSHIIKEYSKSADFTKKSEKTRKDYMRYLAEIEDIFGDLPFSYLETPRARGKFKEWRDTMADRPRTADYAWSVLSRVLSFGKDRGLLAVNVCERGGRLYVAQRADKIWTTDIIQRFIRVASPELQLALMMALWTGQRQGDLLRVTWPAYDGKTLRIKQGKTGARVLIPVGAPLRDLLGAPRKSIGTILVNSRCQPWTTDGFKTSWGKACVKAGIDDLTFHDLRGTAVTRLALAGCSTSQIASITGHALKDVERILDAHYLGGKVELAEVAISKLERFTNSL